MCDLNQRNVYIDVSYDVIECMDDYFITIIL